MLTVNLSLLTSAVSGANIFPLSENPAVNHIHVPQRVIQIKTFLNFFRAKIIEDRSIF